MPELSTLGYTIDVDGNIILDGTPGVGANGGDLTVNGGTTDTFTGGSVFLQAGNASAAGGSGGDVALQGGSSVDTEGGYVGLGGGNSDEANGGLIDIAAGNSGTGGNGGDVTIRPGCSVDETGDYGDVIINVNAVAAAVGGNIKLMGLKTANPNVAGAIWSDAGTLKISAG